MLLLDLDFPTMLIVSSSVAQAMTNMEDIKPTNGEMETSSAPSTVESAITTNIPTASTPAAAATMAATAPTPSTSRPPRAPRVPPPPPPPNHTLLERRVTTIQEGDNVMLMLPSEIVKVIVATSTGTTSLGKFGSFPTSQLIGKSYGITYEIVSSTSTDTPSDSPAPVMNEEEQAAGIAASGKGKGTAGKGKSWKGKGKGKEAGGGEGMVLRPMKKARMEELEETDATNDLIPAIPTTDLLSATEIIALREAGCSAEEIIQRQIEKHDGFKLKTEYSKEKYKKRKEKKYTSSVLPLAPTMANIITSYNTRANSGAVLNFRIDTLSQMLNLGSIRPGGRYLVVEDGGGLIVGALLDRMGGEGRIMQLTENDSPPAWSILESMNFPKHILDNVVRFLNWYEAEEDYEPVKPDAPEPGGNPTKEAAKSRKRDAQLAALNRTREELHRGEWDGLIMASDLSPPSVLETLLPYLGGSANVVVYSQWLAVLTDTLQGMRERPEWLAPNLTESWTRRYQVLPGRTHPTMTTSATGGYLLHAIRVHANRDLGFARAPHQPRSKRSLPGEGQRALRKKAKLAASEGETSVGTPVDNGSEVEDVLAEMVELEANGDVAMEE